MKSLNEMQYGPLPATLNERMEWVELLYHEAQAYKTLIEFASDFPEKDFREIYLKIGSKKKFLLDYLPPLRKHH